MKIKQKVTDIRKKKIMKKRLGLMMILLISLILTGCGNEKKVDAKDNKEQLTIKNSGWSYFTSDSTGYISYGIEIYNQNKIYLASFPTIMCVGKDKTGKILFSYDENLDYIYPGETLFYGETFNVDEEPASIELTIEVSNYNFEKIDSVKYPKNTEFKLSNISEFKDKNVERRYTGEIINNSNTDIHAALIVLVYKQNGKIVGGDNTYSDELNSKQKSTFEMYVNHIPEYDSYELTTHVSMIN